MIENYVKPGQCVAELYHGERSDMLRRLSNLVGPDGKVYGIDSLNPFSDVPEMSRLRRQSNVSLILADIPPIPKYVPPLDAILIREFVWTYNLTHAPEVSENAETYKNLDTLLKRGGHLTVILTEAEQEPEASVTPEYQATIKRYLPTFEKVHHRGPLMVFEKN